MARCFPSRMRRRSISWAPTPEAHRACMVYPLPADMHLLGCICASTASEVACAMQSSPRARDGESMRTSAAHLIQPRPARRCPLDFLFSFSSSSSPAHATAWWKAPGPRTHGRWIYVFTNGWVLSLSVPASRSQARVRAHIHVHTCACACGQEGGPVEGSRHPKVRVLNEIRPRASSIRESSGGHGDWALPPPRRGGEGRQRGRT